MHTQMIGNLPLGITVFLHRLFDSLIPPPHILKNSSTVELPKTRPLVIPLSLGYLRNTFMTSDIIDEGSTGDRLQLAVSSTSVLRGRIEHGQKGTRVIIPRQLA